MIVCNINQVRAKSGISMRELSRRSGVSLANLSKIENGLVEPKISTVYRLCKILHCKAEDIFIDDEEVE